MDTFYEYPSASYVLRLARYIFVFLRVPSFVRSFVRPFVRLLRKYFFTRKISRKRMLFRVLSYEYSQLSEVRARNV